ncbi:hypothetical protein PO124_15220 [Bacillus licheniformis]|nr:hypothetical protein [Bacillus licheniformis]
MTPESLHQLEDRIELMKLAAVKGRKQIRSNTDQNFILSCTPSAQMQPQTFLDQLESRIERYRRISGYKILTTNRLYLSMNTWIF